MIEIVIGKTGSGKSMFAVQEFVVKELLNENTYIITNLALRVGEINAYLQRKYPDRSINAVDRIRILSDAEASRFYLHRESNVDFREPTVEESRDKTVPWMAQIVAAADASRFRLIYIIDEAQIFFDAREWANVGPAMNTIMSQHRKLGIDRIVLVTQFLAQLEKRLREHAVNFYECQNWGMKRYAWFKLPSWFTISVTDKQPPYPASYRIRRQFDKEIAALYDTTAGVGVKGGRQPEVKKAKGLPLWTALIPIAIVVIAFTHGPDALMRWVSQRGHKTPVRDEGGGKTNAAGPGSALPTGFVPPVGVLASPEKRQAIQGTGVTPPQPQPQQTQAIIEPRPPIWVTGYALSGQRFILQMSDGSRITEEDTFRLGNPFAFIGRGYLEMKDGTRYHYRPPEYKGLTGPVKSDSIGYASGTLSFDSTPESIEKPQKPRQIERKQ